MHAAKVAAAQISRPTLRSNVVTSGPIHEVLGPCRRGIPKTGCLNCGSSYDHVGQALGTRAVPVSRAGSRITVSPHTGGEVRYHVSDYGHREVVQRRERVRLHLA